jgi:hypothetical protein
VRTIENQFELGPFPAIKLGTVTAGSINEMCSPSGDLTKLTNEYWYGLKKLGFEVPAKADIPAKIANRTVNIHVGEGVTAAR